MDVQQVLRWIIMAIVLLVAVALLTVILRVGVVLLWLALKILVVLLVIAVILRFVSAIKERRRY
ncbi:MAG TPA: hypothetical protein VFG50_08680 [Rhodothermales bacterium]|nr:hypothetical protein [Rhodothermales bacterium]